MIGNRIGRLNQGDTARPTGPGILAGSSQISKCLKVGIRAETDGLAIRDGQNGQMLLNAADDHDRVDAEHSERIVEDVVDLPPLLGLVEH